MKILRGISPTLIRALGNPAVAATIFVALYTLPVRPAEHADGKDHVAAHGPVIRIEDVARFYKVYDAAGAHPTAEQLQRDS